MFFLHGDAFRLTQRRNQTQIRRAFATPRLAVYCNFDARERGRACGAGDWTMTGVFENLSADMHSNQITSSSYHSLHKSQESPTLPVSTATDSNYYNSQQPGHCAGSPFGQLGPYQYHGSAANTVPYSAKSYELGFSSSYGAYSSYGPNSSPTPVDTGKLKICYFPPPSFCLPQPCVRFWGRWRVIF